ncbi:head-tail connector protein [Rubinisphaera sp.]|uniref:head-tail connector protein n=1 Tax=Rubinisphaera sp. TaxID=2024857 RepID=UPI000C111036|nr:head-tail connector protein [Rubinisphaera sp.]MBV07677.1 hypothetical protein [Rubinisphaera sp.]HCS53283.1 hypothetical protein [Planctomycetaceae bacterium]|tara:strand:- start:1011 stop:1604 length:594 start_codon:yes stop_codon:yes gene_type:complete
MGVSVMSQPAEEPLSLDMVKEQLRIDGDDENAHLQRLMRSARHQVEQQCWRQLMRATLFWTMDEFPECRTLFFPRPPLVEVTSVKYYDLDGQLQTFDPMNYFVDTTGEPGRIALKSAHDWPETNLQPGSVQITYEAGLEDPADVPEDLIVAMLLIVGHQYTNREAVALGTIATELPMGVNALLTPHRFRDYRILGQF